ncbi:hypothetical protein BDN72DRAFT_882113 [Pluteus cervinus]|uniref:Uncharacterized protein n=1 Tax=Pluteus cervinus TaxID=181527 RepID=A0ACD3AC14_9AGAR|nr:hypothetical protein BDN72DRAFT_882113 [Pluteus cervinus]
MPPKRRHPRNTSGLRNHQNHVADRQRQSLKKEKSRKGGHKAVNESLPGIEEDIGVSSEEEEGFGDVEVFMSLEEGNDEVSEVSEIEVDSDAGDEWEIDDEGLKNLIALAMEEKGNLLDGDWLPHAFRSKKTTKERFLERPSEYVTGPVVANKAPRTQRRHNAKAAQDPKKQTALDFFGYKKHTAPRVIPPTTDNSTIQSLGLEPIQVAEVVRIQEESVEVEMPPAVRIREESVDVEIPPVVCIREECVDVQIPTESPLDVAMSVMDNVQIREESVDVEIPPLSEECVYGEEEWEEDLSEAIEGTEVRGWGILRVQIEQDMKKKKSTYTASQRNQLLILRNFATLRLKGDGIMSASKQLARQFHKGEGTHLARKIRSLARHYQTFEQLPDEKRGGARGKRSVLLDETVQTAAREWLGSQTAGSITPHAFQQALNEAILPSLSVTPKRPLSERTARRWLVRLGWRMTVLRKGVYMDGHERADVVQYRQHVFLPLMEDFEKRMATYDFDETTRQLKRTPPTLKPGEKEVIPNFQDESCFTVNEYKSRAWLKDGQTILQKKGRGRLIHVSDFINPEEGRLRHLDKDGNTLAEARKIIYPGSNGDAWWDCDQLLVQVKHTIQVFEKQHPNCVSLFVFDQSSAHASLPPDALKAFEMNKSDGGKQRKQRDTIIPQSNPYPEYRGKPQSMTLPNGEQKGLERVLTERGFDVKGMRAKCKPVCPVENQNCCMARLLSRQEDFTNQVSQLELIIRAAGHECIFLPKFHCELNPIEMYWGWAKYRYREEPKENFAAAKVAAEKYLDACPAEVIRRFINRSFRFMSAYRRGLTGKAAAWAVRKQSAHRRVTEGAMMSIEAVLN